ncbi:MAG: c-type cytochrome, partial [Planctomycetales bacterium]|nr:c-type cytochrome [Planctomycetales bacterium]
TADAYKAAPLWAFNQNAGAATFKKLCAACHQPDEKSERLAPKLEGTGSKGIDYIIENVIDPNAVIGRDFQARMVVTDNGQVYSGLVESENDSAITLRTATSSVTIAKDQIEAMRVSDDSFMPVGLLNSLNERERIELLKYLMSL